MIDEKEVEKAVDFLRDSSEKAALATANRKYLEEHRKILKAQIMKEHIDKPVTAQEREAYSDERYKKCIEGISQSTFEEAKLRFQRHAAEAKIMAWQTQSANMRATKV